MAHETHLRPETNFLYDEQFRHSQPVNSITTPSAFDRVDKLKRDAIENVTKINIAIVLQVDTNSPAELRLGASCNNSCFDQFIIANAVAIVPLNP